MLRHTNLKHKGIIFSPLLSIIIYLKVFRKIKENQYQIAVKNSKILTISGILFALGHLGIRHIYRSKYFWGKNFPLSFEKDRNISFG